MNTRTIRITAGPVSVPASLNESRTADAVWAALPIVANAQTWGDEIYFAIDVTLGEESARDVVEEGDLGYWPPGQAFCIFFGPTPASHGKEIRPASAVNVLGRIDGDAKAFTTVAAGAQVTIERA